MMSIAAALGAATALVGSTLPAGLIRAPVGECGPARPAREAEAGEEPAPEDGALLVAIEEGLREAGYLAN